MIAEMHGLDEEENFFKITSIARAKGAHVAAVIAGDWHHYNRYYAHELDVHFITSGGGGAFLHPTHVLKNNISVRWPEQQDDAAPGRVRGAGRPSRPSLACAALRHAPQAQHQGCRHRRRSGRAGRPGRARATAESCAQAQAAAAASAQMLPQQIAQLPAEPRQRPVPVLQPGLCHRHRLDLLDRDLGVPDPRQPLSRSLPARSITSAWAPRSGACCRRMPIYLHPGHHRVHRTDHPAGRALCHPHLVCRCRRAARACGATPRSSLSERRTSWRI